MLPAEAAEPAFAVVEELRKGRGDAPVWREEADVLPDKLPTPGVLPKPEGSEEGRAVPPAVLPRADEPLPAEEERGEPRPASRLVRV